MRVRSQRDFWAGLFFIAIAVAFVWMATGYRLGTPSRMGPAYFPIIVSCLLGALGVAITVRSFALDGPPVDRFGLRQLIITLIAVVLFGVTLTYLGLAAAIVVLVLVGAVADPAARPLETIILAIGLALFSVAMFVWLLKMPLQVWPEGLF